MLTEQQIQDQQNYERKQIQGGLDKLRANTTKLEEKTYASTTVYGSACVSSILPDLIAFIDSKKEKYLRFNAAKDKHIFHTHILPSVTEQLGLFRISYKSSSESGSSTASTGSLPTNSDSKP